jgi:hypothetical protein
MFVFIIPLKATGIISSPASLRSGEQGKVDARYTSSARSEKYLIQFIAMGERPSATKSKRMRSIYQKLLIRGKP